MHHSLARLLHLYLWPMRRRWTLAWPVLAFIGLALWLTGQARASTRLSVAGAALMAPTLCWMFIAYVFWMPVLLIDRRRRRSRRPPRDA
jgi:hypothetical protein